MGIVLVILSYLLTKIIALPFFNLLLAGGLVRKNYRDSEIPISLGLIIFFGSIPSLLLYSQLFKIAIMPQYLLLLAFTMFVGFFDDILGNHETKGLKGHFKLLIYKGKLSTGSFKAISISFISLFFALNITENYLLMVINFGILILATNSFNLLDVRPGRVLKVFTVIWLFMFIFKPESRIFLSIIMAAAAAYAPLDLQAKGMLGDTGSNLLGMVAGISLVLYLSPAAKTLSLLFLVYLHYYTEKKSLTAFIERRGLLKIIDDLGR
ncbi:MAG: hypothetical protein ACOYVD_04860 [Bacillota bacterium]